MAFIPVNEPLLDGREKQYLIECIESGWISSEGPFVERFEAAFAARAGRKHGIAVSNGSMALDASVAALHLGPGDEVILPTFTIISCAAAVVRSGATPVLVDADPLTWNMTADAVAERITTRTKAILVVHLYGLPADMDPILELASRHGLAVIEDAAEMHGQTYRGRPCGSFGNLSTFSFYPNKHITTGEGGMIVTDDDALAARCRSLRNLCFQPQRRFVHEELGWNLRMTNLQAALGLAQLERLDEFVARKRRMGARYTDLLQAIPRLQLPVPATEYADNIYWVYGVVLPKPPGFDRAPDAQAAMKYLADQQIGTRPFFWCMHEQPVFTRMGLFAGEHHPVAEHLARCGFYLPSGIAIRDAQIERAAAVLKELCS